LTASIFSHPSYLSAVIWRLINISFWMTFSAKSGKFAARSCYFWLPQNAKTFKISLKKEALLIKFNDLRIYIFALFLFIGTRFQSNPFLSKKAPISLDVCLNDVVLWVTTLRLSADQNRTKTSLLLWFFFFCWFFVWLWWR
jgi:hypothetical protein